MKINSEKLERFRPKEPSERFLRVREKIANFAWSVMERKYQHDFLDQESRANLVETNEFLKTGSVVVYVNHQKIVDTPIAISLALKNLSEAKNFLGPAGMKHFDINRDPMMAVLLRALKLLHVYAVPVVQHNEANANQYQASDKAMMAAVLRELAEEMLGTPGNVYGIAPEGTRNKSGQLLEGRFGLGRLRHLHQPDKVGYLPIAVIYPEKDAAGNETRPFQIKVGKMVFWNDLVDSSQLPKGDDSDTAKFRDKIVTDALMQQLAQLLPLEMRGYYSDPQEQTLFPRLY